MNIFHRRGFDPYPAARMTYSSMAAPGRKELQLEKIHYNDIIATTGITNIKESTAHVLSVEQFRK
ncbi:hypothetical protein [Ectobacillus funiculus]|uniref:hypothetical protein n=1 Tax=Ectobacillus funiculus TaxID=137993 RepID=UPI00196A32E9|nr:hypothetical protein [Ectobacillus funiculus]